MIKKGMLYYHTLKHLKWQQIKYRLLYALSKPKLQNHLPQTLISSKRTPLKLIPSIQSVESWSTGNRFTFLNQTYAFQKQIDWNFDDYGKLWTYNLSYFEYLSQADMTKKVGLALIFDFIDQKATIKDGFEPFPISLRLLFWVKFLSKYQIRDERIDQSLSAQLRLLSSRPEFHLLGNHLLENAFGLLFGAYYLGDQAIFDQAGELLQQELKEQILSDGAHFELSPMYHNLILYRILDAINLIRHNDIFEANSILKLLTKQARIMLGWAVNMQFRNGDIPKVNDTAIGVAPSTSALIEYATQLNIQIKYIPLKTSGYRKIEFGKSELLIDVGQIGPDYIPGHAHSDTFNFILHHKEKPIIVDTGISTYEANKQRLQERSTSAHNTVRINEMEQSEVWGSFRVARRAQIINLEESRGQIIASHNGYQRIGAKHTRKFLWKEQQLDIIDEITKGQRGEAFIHLHPKQIPKLEENMLHLDIGNITFSGSKRIALTAYDYARGYNDLVPAQKVIIEFEHTLKTSINLQ